MKTLIIILIIASLLQTTILPINLVLIILICRAYLKAEPANLYLAFAFGLLISYLDLKPIGVQSIVYLTSVLLIQVLSKSRLAGHWLLITPISLIFLSLNQLSTKVIWESLFSLPIFYLIRWWEERFIAQKDIKLRL